MKKIISLIVCLAMVSMMFVGCGDKKVEVTDSPATTETDATTTADATEAATEVTEKSLPAMTTDAITLNYISWENEALSLYMAGKFMEKYPNITVNVISSTTADINTTLSNMAGAGEFPDVFWYLGDCDVPIRNGWFADLTELFENDSDADQVLETLKVQGYFDGVHKLAMPGKYLPYVIFLDKDLFERMNVPMPSADWKYSEMIALMKTMTFPEQGIFGYNSFTKIVTMSPIVNNDAWGEFGWDGEKYDMTGEWAEALNQQSEYVRTKVHAPAFGTDENAAAFGAADTWAAASGKLAMQLDAFWTINYFTNAIFVDKGIDWVPYVVPQGDNATTLHKPAFVDFNGVSSASEHPREAYELAKFMTWGKEGWVNKLEAYATLTLEDGSKVFPFPDNLPIVDDQELWDGVAKLLPQTPEMVAFLERSKEPVPLGGSSQPGFGTFLNEVYFNGEYGDVEAAISNGEISAEDVAQELTDKLNQIHQETLDELATLIQ